LFTVLLLLAAPPAPPETFGPSRQQGHWVPFAAVVRQGACSPTSTPPLNQQQSTQQRLLLQNTEHQQPAIPTTTPSLPRVLTCWSPACAIHGVPPCPWFQCEARGLQRRCGSPAGPSPTQTASKHNLQRPCHNSHSTPHPTFSLFNNCHRRTGAPKTGSWTSSSQILWRCPISSTW
jgi:hypothetical protein